MPVSIPFTLLYSDEAAAPRNHLVNLLPFYPFGIMEPITRNRLAQLPGIGRTYILIYAKSEPRNRKFCADQSDRRRRIGKKRTQSYDYRGG